MTTVVFHPLERTKALNVEFKVACHRSSVLLAAAVRSASRLTLAYRS